MITLSYLIPTYNEEENIKPLVSYLQRISDWLVSQHPDLIIRIVICDNCSLDNTYEEIEKHLMTSFNTDVIRFAFNYGFHFSTSYLVSKSTSDVSVLIPADMQIPFERVVEAVSKSINSSKSTLLCRSTKGVPMTSNRVRFIVKAKDVFYSLLAFFQNDIVRGYYGMGAYVKEDIDKLQTSSSRYFEPYQLRLVLPQIIYKPNIVFFREENRLYGSSGFGMLRYIKEALSLFARSELITERGLQILLLVSFAFIVILINTLLIIKLTMPNAILPGFTTPIVVSLISCCLNMLGLYALWLKIERNSSTNYLKPIFKLSKHG